MGVIQVKQRPRTQLPPGQSGLAKPSFAIADRSGEQAAFGAAVSIAGGILNKTIQAQENEQVSIFEGSYNAEVVKFNGLVRSNPGASEEQVQKWMKEANDNIQKAGAVPTNRNARRRTRDTISKNLPAFNERMEASWSAIESERMMNILNDDIEIAVQNLDKAEVEKLVTEASGNLIDAEQVKSIIKLKHLRIDKLSKIVAKQVQADEDRRLIDGQVNYINGLLYHERLAALLDLTGLEQVDRNEIRARVERQMDVEMEEVEKVARNQLLRLTNGKPDPDWTGAKAIINANLDNFGTDWHTNALNKVRNAASILAEKGVNPYETTMNPEVYYKDRELASKGELTIKDIEGHTGFDGYSDTDAAKLKKIIKDPVGESDRTLKDALAEVESFADLRRKGLRTDLEGISKEERKDLRKSRATILREATEIKRQLEQIKILDPDIEPKQYNDRVEAILNPVKQNQANKDIGSWWQRLRLDWDIQALGGAFGGGFPVGKEAEAIRKKESKAERDRLQAIWEQFTKEEQDTAMEAMRQGKTAEEIIAFFEANK